MMTVGYVKRINLCKCFLNRQNFFRLINNPKTVANFIAGSKVVFSSFHQFVLRYTINGSMVWIGKANRLGINFNRFNVLFKYFLSSGNGGFMLLYHSIVVIFY